MTADMGPWTVGAPCPCGNGETGGKLTRFGHVIGCICPSCRGRRNRRAGQRSQAKGYHQLDGKRPNAPTHEEWMDVSELHVKWENKHGEQIPASFRRFVELEWTRRALSQAERSIPIGVQAYAAVRLDLGRGGTYMVVRL